MKSPAMTRHIPKEFIQQLLNRADIVDLIDSRVPLKKKSGSNYFACCPFHTEKNPSFCVSQQKQFYHCFGCGIHGNAIDFLMQYDHLHFPEAIEALAKQLGIEVPYQQISASQKKSAPEQNLFELLENIAQFYQQELRQQQNAIDYLKNRGISGSIAKEFGLGFSPTGWDPVLKKFGKTPESIKSLLDAGMIIKKEGGYYDRFRERIMFPIRDKRGRVIGFGGRILDKGEPKYLNSPETVIFQKGHELYGLHHVLKNHRPLSRLLIVEGYMDVIALFQHGITYAVATLGTATTTHHLQRLFRYTSDIVFCFDGDQAGKTAAWRALLVLLPLVHDGLQVRFMFLPEGEDPDSLVRKIGKNAFEEKIQSALTLSQYFFQSISNQVDLSSMDGRAHFVKSCAEHLQKMPDSIFKNMMLEELEKKAGMGTQKFTQKKSSITPLLKKTRPASPLRLAMILLVQQPELAMLLSDPLPTLDIQGFDLFSKILHSCQAQKLSTGALLELWRDREESALLAKLAQMEHMVPDAGIQQEFLGAVARLKKSAHEQTIRHLLAKASQGKLSQEEKQKLNELIHHKSN